MHLTLIIMTMFLFLGGFLWRLGGSDRASISVRRIGVAILLGELAFLGILSYFPFINWLYALLVVGATVGIAFTTFTLGYGIPDNFDGGDEGSPIGRFWFWKVFNGGYHPTRAAFWADVFTRITVGFCYGLSYIPYIIYRRNYIMALVILIPMIGIPIIRISRVDKTNGWQEEFLIGMTIILGMFLTVGI